jgi:hypothetical protein
MICGVLDWCDIVLDIMTRTIISLNPQDKAWLDRKARKDGVAMTQVVREAVRRMRQQEEISFEQLLNGTAGIWRKGDGLAWQKKLRKQWQ